MRRKTTYRLIIAAVSLVVALAVAVPLYLHWRSSRPIYLQEPGHEKTGHRYLHDPHLGWRNIPGWSATTNGKKLTINSRGLRDREYALAKPAGVKRILVLGDSYTWGYGVADEEIYTEVLERSLAKRGARVQVINSGVSGWGTDQEYLFLEREGIKYQPDLVVLALFIINDPENSASSRQYGLAKPLFTDTALTLSNVPVPRPGAEAPEVLSRVEALSLTVAIIKAMAALCKKHGASLVVLKFGCYPGPVSKGIASWDRRLEREIGLMPTVTLLDLDRTMADARVDNEQIIRGNSEGHWNARGHQLVARYLGAFLEEQSMLQVPTP